MTEPFTYQLRVTSAHRWERFSDVALAPDGVLLATTSNDGLVRVWEVGTGRLRWVLRGHERDMIHCVAWSPDGRLLASGADDKTVCLWDVTNGSLWGKLVGHGEIVQSVQWSADGAQLASGSYSRDSYGSPIGRTCIWDVASGELIAKQPEGKDPKQHPPSSSCAGFVARAAKSLSAVYLYDAVSGERLRTIGGPGVWKVAWSPDGKLLASQLADDAVQIWDAATAELRHTLVANTAYGRLAWASDGSYLATSGNDNDIQLWDMMSGTLLHRLSAHTEHVQGLAWSADGRTLASGGNDCTVRLWSAAEGKLLRTLPTLETHLNWLKGLKWSADGKRLLSMTCHSRLHVWDTATGDLLQTLNENEDFMLRDLAWSARGDLVVGSSWGKTIRLWDVASGKLVQQLECHDGNIDSIAFSPDQTLLASGSKNGNVTVWAIETGAQLQSFATNLPAHELKEVAFVASGPFSASPTFGQTPYGASTMVVTFFELSACVGC